MKRTDDSRILMGGSRRFFCTACEWAGYRQHARFPVDEKNPKPCPRCGGSTVTRKSAAEAGRRYATLLLRVDELEERCAHLKRESATDELTGVLNRRGITRALARELARASRLDRSLSVAMIDVDHLKEVNDRDGHRIGDEVLTEVALAIKRALRSTDAVGRVGGDEFLLVLDMGVRRAAVLLERLRKVIGIALEAVGLPSVTISAGTVVAGKLETSGEVVERADRALYGAKKTGRDRVGVGG